MPERSQISRYYDDRQQHLLADYVHSNPRTASAIRHALSQLPASTSSILDIGCGIGWSTHELARRRPRATAIGVDLSPQAVATANRLFGSDAIRFLVADARMADQVPAGLFSFVALLDVYEHIPVADRPALHRLLRDRLAPDGTVVVTCPTPEHQAFLRRQLPDSLQPVDEDVDEAALWLLARDLGGDLVQCNVREIWPDVRYLHATVSRSPQRTRRRPGVRLDGALESVRQRARRVERRLQVAVTAHGYLLPRRPDRPTIVVVAPNEYSYSETFIRSHMERLPFSVRFQYGGNFPISWEDGSPIMPGLAVTRWRLSRAVETGLRLPDRSIASECLARAWRRRGVSAVLAEYGTTGADLLAACRRAGLPLLVHFHGFDAHHRPTLERYAAGYRAMFEYASAVFVVSSEMYRQVIALGADRERVVLNPCGVDLDLFRPPTTPDRRATFLAVGRFVEKKAPHLTLLAFAGAHKVHPECRLAMIGDGPLLGSCRALATSLGIAASVDFLRPQPPPEVARWMQRSLAFVQHSVHAQDGDCEGSPVAVAEAQACGLPVIATRHAGIQDEVADGQTGLLCDELDIESMQRHMIAVLDDRQLAVQLGSAARERAVACFRNTVHIERIARALDCAMAGRPLDRQLLTPALTPV
ncbi:MAG: glycosyltransferase [Deltaproteobacteria bacterium]|nr:glycosyltransferase [Deltaproteobacteria bacterium]